MGFPGVLACFQRGLDLFWQASSFGLAGIVSDLAKMFPVGRGPVFRVEVGWGLGKGQVKDCVSRRIFTLYGGSRRGGRVGIAPSQHQFVFLG